MVAGLAGRGCGPPRLTARKRTHRVCLCAIFRSGASADKLQSKHPVRGPSKRGCGPPDSASWYRSLVFGLAPTPQRRSAPGRIGRRSYESQLSSKSATQVARVAATPRGASNPRKLGASPLAADRIFRVGRPGVPPTRIYEGCGSPEGRRPARSACGAQKASSVFAVTRRNSFGFRRKRNRPNFSLSGRATGSLRTSLARAREIHPFHPRVETAYFALKARRASRGSRVLPLRRAMLRIAIIPPPAPSVEQK